MAEEEFDGTDTVFYLLGAGQRGAHKARKTLPQGVVEALDVVGFPCFFRDGFVAFRRNDTVVHVILAFPVKTRNFVRWSYPHALNEPRTLINLYL